jgi:hypothetical protein
MPHRSNPEIRPRSRSAFKSPNLGRCGHEDRSLVEDLARAAGHESRTLSARYAVTARGSAGSLAFPLSIVVASSRSSAAPSPR